MQNISKDENEWGAEEGYQGHVTDSVHERFRQIHVRCDDCNRDILGNEAAIRKHFDDSHPSNKHCCYCKGKVFMYRRITTEETADSKELSQNFIYHKCKHNEEVTNASKEPT